MGRGDRLGSVGRHLCQGPSLPEGLRLSQASLLPFFLATGFLPKPGTLVGPTVGPRLLHSRLTVPLFPRPHGLLLVPKASQPHPCCWGLGLLFLFPGCCPDLCVSGCYLLFCPGSSTGPSPSNPREPRAWPWATSWQSALYTLWFISVILSRLHAALAPPPGQSKSLSGSRSLLCSQCQNSRAAGNHRTEASAFHASVLT